MKFFLILFLLPLPFLLPAEEEEETMDITTNSGQVFEDARIERVNPDGIDIGYVNDKGRYVLKGLLFKDLPVELQKKFGYNPEKSKKFESEVKKYEQKEIEKVADEEKTRLERITEQIKAKFAGEKITLKPADLRYAIHAWRRSVEITPVKDTKRGCVVKIDKVVSGKPIRSELVLLDGIHLPAEGSWSGFLYPAGVQAIYEKKPIPVFTGSLDDSTEILTRYLEIYAEYAAEEKGKKNEAAAAQAPDQSETQTNAQTAQTTEQTVQTTEQTAAVPEQWTDDGSRITYYPYGSYYGFVGDGVYFISGNFTPVAWWNRVHPDRPPHRPPPPPPYDPPGRPHRPPHRPPYRPEKPDKPGRPARPAARPENKPGTTQITLRQDGAKQTLVKTGSADQSKTAIRQESRPGTSQITIQRNNAKQIPAKTAPQNKPKTVIRQESRPGTSQITLQRNNAPRTSSVKASSGSAIQRPGASRSYEIRRSGTFRQAVPANRRGR